MEKETTVVYYPAPGAPLARAELAKAIGTALVGNTKLEQAVRQMMAERLARATVRAADEELTERDAGHAGGRLAELLSLQGEFAACVRAAEELAPRKPLKESRRA